MMNEQPIRETARAGVRWLMYFFVVTMCCISSEARFFHTRWPLIVNASGPTIDSEK
jgi:hypothetical protein